MNHYFKIIIIFLLKTFGTDVSQYVIGMQMTFAYAGIMISPMICGLLGQNVGMFIFPIYIICLFILMLLVTASSKKLFLVQKNNKLKLLNIINLLIVINNVFLKNFTLYKSVEFYKKINY